MENTFNIHRGVDRMSVMMSTVAFVWEFQLSANQLAIAFPQIHILVEQIDWNQLKKKIECGLRPWNARIIIYESCELVDTFFYREEYDWWIDRIAHFVCGKT